MSWNDHDSDNRLHHPRPAVVPLSQATALVKALRDQSTIEFLEERETAAKLMREAAAFIESNVLRPRSA